MKKSISLASLAILLIAGVVVETLPVNAATTASSQLSQSVGAGSLSTSIRDSSGSVVSSPSFAMNAATISTSTQTVTGTFGSSSQRITVDNPGGATNGWTLALAATTGATATWTSGGNTYAFNGTSTTGQLTVDPSVSTLTVTSPATSTGITKGTASTFTAATPITLLTASSSADTIWNGYITGVGLSQVIPASQASGTYVINMTQTVTAS